MSAHDGDRMTSLQGAASRRGWYVLEERHAALLLGRVVTIVVIAAIAAAAPVDDLSGRDRVIAVAACALALALHAVLGWAPARWPRRLLTAVDIALVVDALLIVTLALVSGGTDSLALWLLPLTALAATLALGVRSGVKAAVLAAIVVGAVLVGDDDGAAVDAAGPLVLTVAMVVVAGALATVNERELTRRGERMTALHTASVAFVGADGPEGLAGVAADAARRLLPDWDAEVRLDGGAVAERTWRDEGWVRLEMPVVAHERGEPERPLGAICARRPAPRMGPARIRGQQLLALRTLAMTLSVALVQADLVHRLERLSLADPLTGLGNRRAFDESLAAELARARRAGSPLGLVMLDVDHFKRFNDRHGHQAGDDALVGVGRVLLAVARAEDRACRIGGEEFAVVLPGADEAAAAAVAERIRRGAEKAPAREPVTVSLGVASTAGDEDADGLLARADARLYAAKEAGRNRVVAVTPAR
jgi:diguanylate cyclase (GGDEF)-like protein